MVSVSGFRRGPATVACAPGVTDPFYFFFTLLTGTVSRRPRYAARASVLLGAASGFRKEPGTRCCFGMDGWKPPWAAVLGENGISFQNPAVLYSPPPKSEQNPRVTFQGSFYMKTPCFYIKPYKPLGGYHPRGVQKQ